MASTHYATPMSPEISENTISVDTCPKPIFYLANGPSDGPIIIFVHGWPELGLSYRHQLAALGSLGFRCIAPDMRGYGRSYIPTHHSECEDEHNVNDLIALLDKLRGNNSKAIFIGHDWGVSKFYVNSIALNLKKNILSNTSLIYMLRFTGSNCMATSSTSP